MQISAQDGMLLRHRVATFPDAAELIQGPANLEPVHDLSTGMREVIKVDICGWEAVAIAMEDEAEKAVSERCDRGAV